MYKLFYTKRFEKDLQLLQKRGFDLELLKKAIKNLEQTGTLPKYNRPHKLSQVTKNKKTLSTNCHKLPQIK